MFKCKQFSKNIVKIKELRDCFLEEWNSSPRNDESCVLIMREIKKLLELATEELSIEWGKYKCLSTVNLYDQLGAEYYNYNIAKITENYIYFEPKLRRLSPLALNIEKNTITPIGKPGEQISSLLELSKNIIAVGKDDGTIRIRNRAGEEITKIKGESRSYFSAIAKLKNGMIASAHGNSIRCWSVETEKQSDSFDCSLGACTRIQEMKNGNLILADFRNNIEVWNPKTKMPVSRFRLSDIDACTITDIREGIEDTVEVIRGGDINVYVCDTKSNKISIKGIKSKKGTAAFASDGSVIACGKHASVLNAFIIHEAKTQKPYYLGNDDNIIFIKELSDHTIATITLNRELKIWGIPGEDKDGL